MQKYYDASVSLPVLFTTNLQKTLLACDPLTISGNQISHVYFRLWRLKPVSDPVKLDVAGNHQLLTEYVLEATP